MPGNWNSGRKKQPTALVMLRGNPGKRRIDPGSEPVPPALPEGFETPPAELEGDARAAGEWRRLAPIVRACGLLSEADRSGLIALCLEWSAYLRAQRRQKRGKDPAARQDGDRALSNCLRLWSELGLTPSGRARVAKLPAAAARTPPASKWGGLV